MSLDDTVARLIAGASDVTDARGMEDADTIQRYRLLGFDAKEEGHVSGDIASEGGSIYGTRGSEIENRIATETLSKLDHIEQDGYGYYGRPLGVARDASGRNLNAVMVAKGVGDVARHDVTKFNAYDIARGEFNRQSAIEGTPEYDTLSEFVKVGEANRAAGLHGAITRSNVRKPYKQPLVGGALRRGVDQTQGMLYGFGQAVSNKFGLESAEAWMDEGRVQNLVEAARNPPKFATTDDVHSLADTGGFIIEKMVENLPNLAVMLSGGVVGLAGRAAVGKAFISGTNAFRAGGAAGAYGVQSGEYFNELLAEGVSADDAAGSSLIAGVPGAALEFAPLGIAIGKLAKLTGSTSRGIKGRLKQLMGAAGVTSVAEGATEYAQTAIGQLNKKHHNPDYDMMSPEAISERNQAAVAGAAAGGGTTVAAGAAAMGISTGVDAVGAMQARRTAEDETLDTNSNAAGIVAYDRDTGDTVTIVPTTPETLQVDIGNIDKLDNVRVEVVDAAGLKRAQGIEDNVQADVTPPPVWDSEAPTITEEGTTPPPVWDSDVPPVGETATRQEEVRDEIPINIFRKDGKLKSDSWFKNGKNISMTDLNNVAKQMGACT